MTNLDLISSALPAWELFSSPLFASEPSWLQGKLTFAYNIMLVALGLGFVIFVHELGHFLAAKLFGVQCDKFYVGFDPPIKIGPIRLPSKLFHFKWGETEYGIGIIPLGGYVKMLGQDDDPRNSRSELERSKSGDETAQEDKPVSDQKPVHNPRSFLAKSVGARMVIISAGVIMNIVFGILMAAVAFYVGVPYNPSVVGRVPPGDPAWMAGLQPGDQIQQINDRFDPELSFREMQQRVLFAGLSDPNKPVRVGFQRDGAMQKVEFVGSMAHSDPAKKIRFLTLGLRSAETTKVRPLFAIAKNLSEDPAYENLLTDLKPGDVIVGINGVKLEIGPYSEFPMGYELFNYLEPKLKETVTLEVMRLDNPGNSTDESRSPVSVSSKPIPMKTLGFYVKPGPVVAVRKDSLAEKAGIETGFEIVAWEGNPIRDAFALVFDIAAKSGEATSITLKRADGTTIEFSWTIPTKFQIPLSELTYGPVGMELPGSGLVYSISNIVSGVASGSKAAASGLKEGDVIIQTQVLPTSDEDKAFYSKVLKDAKSLQQAMKIDSTRNMHYVLTLMQMMRTGMPVEVIFERDGKVNPTRVAVHMDETISWPDRGFELAPLSSNYKVNSPKDALMLGVSEIVRRGGNVLEFLGLLVRGKLPLSALGGPGAIAVEANDAASRGISPLLMFLTMLSANLAIINFLPIPALDGGHMVFLTYEAIMGKPADEEFEARMRLLGVLMLLCLMGLVIFNDVVNITAWVRG
jgi:regulator of sigma E protease